MMKTVAILTTLALAAAATLTFADPGSGRGGMLERLKAADTNADGMISREEAKALPRIAAHFDEIDANKDGQLDRVELTNYAVQQFIDMDTNKDRFLTDDEFKKAQEDETKKMRAIIQAMQPAQPAQPPRPAPAPAQQRGAPPPPQPAAPQGLAPGLPQGTR